MQPLQSAAGVVEPALGAPTAELGRWLVWVAVFHYVEIRRGGGSTRQLAHRALPVLKLPALGMPRGTAISTAAPVCSLQQVWWSLHWVLLRQAGQVILGG